MSKKMILCVVLALSLILVGTGYAYWTDTLNVTTKATTGDLDVTFVDLGAYAQYNNEAAKANWSIIDGIEKKGTDDNLFEGYVGAYFFGAENKDYNDVFEDKEDDYYAHAAGYNSVEMDAEIVDGEVLPKDYGKLPYGKSKGTIAGDTIEIELLNLYPGYAQAFRSDIVNIGTIAAKLSNVDIKLSKLTNDGVEMSITPQAKALIGVALLVNDENPETYKQIVKLASNFDRSDIFTLGGVDFVRLSAIDRETIDIEKNFILVPGKDSEHRADLYIGIAVDPDADGNFTSGNAEEMSSVEDSLSENQGVQVDIKFGWDQFNEGNTVYTNTELTNILQEQNRKASVPTE